METTSYDETVSALLVSFTKGPHPEPIRSELTRFLGNDPPFHEALSLKKAEPLLRAQNAGHFLYHQASGLVFTSMMFGRHQLVMAYIEALHKTDFSQHIEQWEYDQAYSFNATSKLADNFIEQGHGFFVSGSARKAGGGVIQVGKAFKWTTLERTVFQDYAKKVL